MPKRVMLTEDEERELRNPKKKVAKKHRGAPPKSDAENLDADVDADIKEPTVTVDPILRSQVRAAEVAPVMDETIWRVFHEMHPSYGYGDIERLNSDEFSYVVRLGLMLGTPEDKPRRGQKVREHRFKDSEIPFCVEHK